MQPGRRVADERPQPLGVLKILVGHGPGVERLEIGKHGGQQPVLVIDDPVQALAKDGRVEQVGNPDAVDPADLVAIARPDPAAGSFRGGRPWTPTLRSTAPRPGGTAGSHAPGR